MQQSDEPAFFFFCHQSPMIFFFSLHQTHTHTIEHTENLHLFRSGMFPGLGSLGGFAQVEHVSLFKKTQFN